MATTLFYAPDIGLSGLLPEEEARHCLKVLRHQPGDLLEITDGQGHIFKARLLSADFRHCKVDIEAKHTVPSPPKYHLAVAPTKNRARMEWLCEKATEIGVQQITFLQCAHNERTKLNMQRLEKVVVSAMKQSGKAHKPTLSPLVDFNAFLSSLDASQKLLAHLAPDASPITDCHLPESDIVVIIGPEGDFSAEEIKAAKENGFQIITLSPYRLRTETAGVVVLTQLHTITKLNETSI